jgi:hypothetical protein
MLPFGSPLPLGFVRISTPLGFVRECVRKGEFARKPPRSGSFDSTTLGFV